MRSIDELLDLSRRLDARFHLMAGSMHRGKDETVVAIARILSAAQTDYALIGGLAVQFRSRDPRTTLDVDLAVLRYDDIPAAELTAAGFRRLERHAHSENWVGPDGTPVQFTDDPELAAAVRGAEVHTVQGHPLRIIAALDLVRQKLRAARDPSRRRSKRLIDLADAIALVDQQRELRGRLDAAERDQLDAAP